MSEKRNINQMEPAYGPEEINAVTEYLQSGGWVMEFKKTRELEAMIADYVGSKYCSILPNGTLTLWAALAVLDISLGDEVIVPNFTMVATPNAVKLAGAEPVFVDVDKDDLCLDLELTEQAINEKTKAIMLVSMCGRCPRVEEFVELAKKHDLHLIEDSAQSLGCNVDGKHLGSFGVFGSFSFSMPKIITMGQGGALVTDDEALYKKLLKFKDFGRTEGGSDNYELLGYNLKFSDLQAAFGIEQMKRMPERVKCKKEIYALYKKNLQDLEKVDFIDTNLEETSPWFIDIFVPEPDELAAFLKEHGVHTRRVYPTLHNLPFYNMQGDFPVSTHISKHGLWLPSASNLEDEDVEYVCERIRSFYQ